MTLCNCHLCPNAPYSSLPPTCDNPLNMTSIIFNQKTTESPPPQYPFGFFNSFMILNPYYLGFLLLVILQFNRAISKHDSQNDKLYAIYGLKYTKGWLTFVLANKMFVFGVQFQIIKRTVNRNRSYSWPFIKRKLKGLNKVNFTTERKNQESINNSFLT